MSSMREGLKQNQNSKNQTDKNKPELEKGHKVNVPSEEILAKQSTQMKEINDKNIPIINTDDIKEDNEKSSSSGLLSTIAQKVVDIKDATINKVVDVKDSLLSSQSNVQVESDTFKGAINQNVDKSLEKSSSESSGGFISNLVHKVSDKLSSSSSSESSSNSQSETMSSSSSSSLSNIAGSISSKIDSTLNTITTAASNIKNSLVSSSAPSSPEQDKSKKLSASTSSATNSPASPAQRQLGLHTNANNTRSPKNSPKNSPRTKSKKLGPSNLASASPSRNTRSFVDTSSPTFDNLVSNIKQRSSVLEKENWHGMHQQVPTTFGSGSYEEQHARDFSEKEHPTYGLDDNASRGPVIVGTTKGGRAPTTA